MNNCLVKNFYDLEVWKEAHKLILEIYKIIKTFPKEERFGIIEQLRRAGTSITANIAEGFGRYHFKDKIKFYYQSRGSLLEVQNFLLLSKDLGYINTEKYNECEKKIDGIKKLTNGLINSISKQIN
ncbi:hypothetical protein A2335_02175 [Candidatus Peregrinibacteria bacterium RIFOXYB2_FULL_32_7]|nr:MAG: hypothetical protein A2335_02175 [Candidatus Peregrinibacteria bacterium RIFOXYB2_FULL_32_7]